MRAPISRFESLPVKDSRIFPLLAVNFDTVRGYWEDLKKAGYMDYRLCDVPSPKMEDAYRLMHQHAKNMYLIQWGDNIAGEFTLTNFTGRAAQIHFSTHPDLHIKQGIPLVKETVKRILHWKESHNEQRYYLNTLFGLTPMDNRAARLYITKVGFKKQFVLPSGMNYMGRTVDALVTTLTRKDV